MLKSRWLKLSKIWSLIERQYWNGMEANGNRQGYRWSYMAVWVSLERSPSCPCRRPRHRRAPFAAPADVRCSTRRSCQPEIASGGFPLPLRLRWPCQLGGCLFFISIFRQTNGQANKQANKQTGTCVHMVELFPFRIILARVWKANMKLGKEFMAFNEGSQLA